MRRQGVRWVRVRVRVRVRGRGRVRVRGRGRVRVRVRVRVRLRAETRREACVAPRGYRVMMRVDILTDNV